MRKILSRRTLLCGAGGALIGLPFLEEMRPRLAHAADAAPPTRLITLFFGLGIAREESLKKFDGPLQAFSPFANKMTIFSNLELQQSHAFGSGEPHFKVGDVTFVGSASTAYPQNLVFQEDAITFATADLELLGAGVDSKRIVHDGISIRVSQGADIVNDRNICRLDVLFGYGVIRPELAVRLWG